MGLLFLSSYHPLYIMAIPRSLDKITPLSHLPTWFFIIGYPLFWLQLYTHTASDGITWPLAWVLFGGIIVIFTIVPAYHRVLARLDVNVLLIRNSNPKQRLLSWFPLIAHWVSHRPPVNINPRHPMIS